MDREIPFLKGYTVFNCEQIDGLPGHFTATPAPVLDPVQRIAHAEMFFDNTKAVIRHGGNQAYYAIDGDYIQMPPFESFRDAESFYATLAHEACHWTRHPSASIPNSDASVAGCVSASGFARGLTSSPLSSWSAKLAAPAVSRSKIARLGRSFK